MGSGFIVCVDQEEILFPYLVTADHVAKRLDEYGFEPIVRLNGKDGVAYQKSIANLSPNAATGSSWRRHTDKTVDLAVALFDDFEEFFAFVPDRQIIKASQLHEHGIGIGDETITVGLFHFHRDSASNSPIVRVGNIAMLPNDRIQTRDYGLMEAYLIEARSIAGLSGSPVFVRETRSFPAAVANAGRLPDGEISPFQVSGNIYLLGVTHGHWDTGIDSEFDSQALREAGVNVGIAIITPAQKLSEILFSEALAKQRSDWLEARKRRLGREIGESNAD